MMVCVVIAVVDYAQGKDVSLVMTSLTVGIFLLLAIFLFRISLQLGNYQKKIRESRSKGPESPGT